MTNPKSLLIVFLAAAPFFISCKDKETSVENTPATVQEATLDQKKQALENAAPATNTTNLNGDLATNPAHGQPGHRCDIPVGAPLNSAGSTTSTPNQSVNLNTTTPAATSGGGNLNPPHGQPGHRCDIKVGDPL